MKKNIIFIIALIYLLETLGLVLVHPKINNSTTNKGTAPISKNARKENEVKETQYLNMVAIFEGDKLVEKFPFVYCEIDGDKIFFGKLRLAYENGEACPIPGSTTGKYNLSDCVLYYSESEQALAEGAHNETLPEQTLADGANSKALLNILIKK